MAKPTVTIIGEEKLISRLRQVEEDVDGRIVDALLSGGLVLQNRWKQNIVAMGAVDTGTYLRSVHEEVLERRPGYAAIGVGTDITDPPYPEYVEYGTSRMEARPAARNAFDTSQGEIQDEVINSLKEVFKRYGRV